MSKVELYVMFKRIDRYIFHMVSGEMLGFISFSPTYRAFVKLALVLA